MKELLGKKHDSDFHNPVNRWNYNALVALAPSKDFSCLEPDCQSNKTVTEHRKALTVNSLLSRLQQVVAATTVTLLSGSSTHDISTELAAIAALPNSVITGYHLETVLADAAPVGVLSVDEAGTLTLTGNVGLSDATLAITYAYGGTPEADLPECDCLEYFCSCETGEVIVAPID